MKYIIYTNPVQFTTDYNHANVIADEHFEKTREIVAIEEVHRLCQFPSQNPDHYKTEYFMEFAKWRKY